MYKLCIISLLLTSIQGGASEVPARVDREIRKNATNEWPGDYQMQAYEIRTQTKSYQRIESWTSKMLRTEDREVCRQIWIEAVDEYPDDYQMQWYEIQTQMEAYWEITDISLLLTSILYDGSESNIRLPARVDREIRKNATNEWPGDYQMQAYKIRTQRQFYQRIEGWAGKMRGTVYKEVCRQIWSDAVEEYPDDYEMQWYKIQTRIDAYLASCL